MSDENALLRAIAANPEEDTPRLAYADWLDEHKPAKVKGRGKKKPSEGNPRAAFIRAQVELARLKEDSMHRRELAFRCRQLLDEHEEKWLEPRVAFKLDWGWSRGFVETFSTTPTELHLRDAELFATHPFRRVWVKEWEGGLNGTALLPADNHITALDLIGNDLRVNDLKKLAKMKHLPHLRELGLMFNDLRDTAVKVLCGEDFFQRLDLLRLGANPFTERGRGQLRKHFGDRVTFAHEREPDRLYAIQNDYLRAGWGKEFTQLFPYGGDAAVFDHAGNLLRFEHGDFSQLFGADYDREWKKWLNELGFKPATIKVKAFRLPDGAGITPFNWWADTYESLSHPQYGEMVDAVERWLDEGQYRFDFVGDDAWFDRTGEVTDT
jgi:uncharacterized protein (TIGR02996 family)